MDVYTSWAAASTRSRRMLARRTRWRCRAASTPLPASPQLVAAFLGLQPAAAAAAPLAPLPAAHHSAAARVAVQQARLAHASRLAADPDVQSGWEPVMPPAGCSEAAMNLSQLATPLAGAAASPNCQKLQQQHGWSELRSPAPARIGGINHKQADRPAGKVQGKPAGGWPGQDK